MCCTVMMLKKFTQKLICNIVFNVIKTKSLKVHEHVAFFFFKPHKPDIYTRPLNDITIRTNGCLVSSFSVACVYLFLLRSCVLHLISMRDEVLQGQIPGAPTVDPSSLPVFDHEREHPSASVTCGWVRADERPDTFSLDLTTRGSAEGEPSLRLSLVLTYLL